MEQPLFNLHPCPIPPHQTGTVTPQGPRLPHSAPLPGAVIWKHAYAVYDEGGFIDINRGFRPTRTVTVPLPSTDRLVAKYPSEESEIMLVAGKPPKISSKLTDTGTVGSAYAYSISANQSPTSYNATPLPAGLVVNTTTGVISGIPTRSGKFNIQITASNASGFDTQTSALSITGAAEAASTPWPVKPGKKIKCSFRESQRASLKSRAIRYSSNQANNRMAKSCHNTTIGRLLHSPSFPLDLTHEEYYAKYFLGPGGLSRNLHDSLSIGRAHGRTHRAGDEPTGINIVLKDVSVSTRASLNIWERFPEIKIRPAPDWPQLNNKLPARFDINNLSLVVPDLAGLKFHGNGHHYGQLKKQPIGLFFD